MALASWMHKGSAMELPAGEKPEGDSAEALCQQKQGQLPSPSKKLARATRESLALSPQLESSPPTATLDVIKINK